MQRVQTGKVSPLPDTLPLLMSQDPGELDGDEDVDIGVAIEITKLRGAGRVLQSLEGVGLSAHVYQAESETIGRSYVLKSHAAIWIGSRVPSHIAILAIRTVVAIWSHLRYVQLSSDGGEPPDYIHDQLFFGGATSTAEASGLKQWTPEEFNSIPDDLNMRRFHQLIRSKYGSSLRTTDALLVGDSE